MSPLEIINLIASIVTIVGGVIAIVRAIGSRQPAVQPSGRAPDIPPPSPAPSEATGTPMPPPPPLSRGRIAVGWAYGLILSIPAIVILAGGDALTRADNSTFAGVFAIAALGVLFIVSGLLPARQSGSLASGVLSAAILAAVTAVTIPLYVTMRDGGTYELGTMEMLGSAFGGVGLLIGLISAIGGRSIHRRGPHARAAY